MGKVFFVIILCVFLKGYTYLESNFLRSDVFKVKDIEIVAENTQVVKEIEKSIEPLKNKSIWDIPIKEIESFLEDDIRIKDITIGKSLPNKLEIKVVENTIKYYASYKGRVYGVDKDRNIFSYLEDDKIKDLSILMIKSKEELNILIDILEKLNSDTLSHLISQISIVDKYNIEIILVDGIKIKTNINIPLDRYELAEKLYLNLKNEGKVLEYIDIRFDDYIVK